MPMTITPNGSSTPPRFEIQIDTPDGTPISSIRLLRRVAGVNSDTRVQPSTGVPSRYVEDPEAPWDTPVIYQANVSYNNYAGYATFTSAAQVLTPDVPAFWAIHPTRPEISMPLDYGDFDRIGVAELSDIVNASQANQHRILNSKFPTLTKTGYRLAPSGTLTLTSMTNDERNALGRILDDETPLLLRAPAAWGWGWEDGYYAIGDLGWGRRLQIGSEPSRTVRLPFQRVMPPAGVTQTSWGWGGVLSGYADWNAVSAAFDDWNAVLSNNPD